MTTDISEQQVRERLASYEDTKVTDELYSFGQTLLHDAVERLNKSDSKAGAMAGYAGGVVALLASTAKMWAGNEHSWHILLPMVATALLFLAAVVAVLSLRLKKTDWLSPDEWMKKECLESGERLRRYHILTMWGVHESLDVAYQKKTAAIRKAEFLMLAAWLLLAVSLFDIARRYAAL
ncbi:MAG TPA: hypothetical protein VGH51_02155 [Candidatus Angelobacter sp.]|jgi:hypothetical protein